MEPDLHVLRLFYGLRKDKNMNSDQIKGKIKQAEGKIQETVGKATHNVGDNFKGKMKQAGGKIQEEVGNAKVAAGKMEHNAENKMKK